MNVFLWALVAVVAILAVLVARGMYLLGQGRDVEYEAREQAEDSAIMGGGFTMLDYLRFGDLPFVSTIEDWLGRDTSSGELARCLDCRHSWISGQQSAQPVCPNCGGKNTRTGGAT